MKDSEIVNAANTNIQVASVMNVDGKVVGIKKLFLFVELNNVTCK